MNNIYDNGTHMLGEVKRIKEYNDRLYKDKAIEEEQWLELVKELVWYKDTDIVSIDYDNGMGMTVEYWEKENILKESD
jgi:hypothetical protein